MSLGKEEHASKRIPMRTLSHMGDARSVSQTIQPCHGDVTVWRARTPGLSCSSWRSHRDHPPTRAGYSSSSLDEQRQY
eukprot:5309818-Pyramimonas_sp.AAC.2